MVGYLISGLAAASMVTASLAAASGLRSADVLPITALASGAAGAAGQCTVKVVRTGTPGTANVMREQLANGSCTCVVTTGAASSNGAAETTVSNLLRDRTCADAPSVDPASGEAAGAGASVGGGVGLLPVVLGAVGAGGLAAGLNASSNG